MNLKQRTASLFLAFFLTCTIPCFANATEPPIDTLQAPFFNDITDHWAESQIKAAVASGYVNGYEDGTFKPNASVTRAEFIKLLVGALKLDVETGSSPWYQGYVTAAKKAGIFADDFEGWNQPILRKEMAVLAVRAGLSGYKQEYDENRYLYEAAKGGILSGTAPGEIEPDGVSTRAQAVVVIERVLAVKSGKTLESDKYAVSAAEILWHKTNILTVLPQMFGKAMPDINGNTDFQYTNMTSTTSNGAVSCSVDQLVAIDLSDKNDPNRKLLTPEYRWFSAFNKSYEFNGTDAYALVSVSKVKFNKEGVEDNYYPCKISINNDDVLKRGSTVNTSKPESVYSIYKYDSTKGTLINKLKPSDAKNGVGTYLSGYIIPKKPFTSNDRLALMFDGQGTGSSSTRIYSSELK
ncbi:S-layer homology domain-containing protein [Paenibacillus sp. B01]|uniref:S-layer homology domain-containing protein n=1 Tax=Paenibacillus sp. B01 TaxID=2660554 RepID=UPI00129BB033|nr:S-layer homology domain-containing protein [Paenibacillus sp. B01]QGG57890.1 S-layer homology domain-containing protein [Paenibacillus sp. B01]